MAPIRIDHARARINDLRVRLHDINILLTDTLTASTTRNQKTRDSLEVAMRALQAVSTDLEAVCNEPLNESADSSALQAAQTRAQSEVDSGEFDSQS